MTAPKHLPDWTDHVAACLPAFLGYRGWSETTLMEMTGVDRTRLGRILAGQPDALRMAEIKKFEAVELRAYITLTKRGPAP